MVIVLDSVSLKRRVLFRIYCLGEKSRVAELPGGSRGHAYTVMITIFLEEKLGILGGTFYPSNTLGRTLQTVEVEK